MLMVVFRCSNVKINILKGIKNADKACGLTVVIDVFRAYSTACYIFGNNANRIIPVDTVDRAYEIKKSNPQFILCGERQGYKPEGFDFGNSPSEIRNTDFSHKTVILTTTSGTLGLIKAVNATEIITGCFLNLRAVANFILNRRPEGVDLLCTGGFHGNAKDEDYICAQLIVDLLNGRTIDFNRELKQLVKRGYAKHFFNEEFRSHPKQDFYLCTSPNKFKFVLIAEDYLEGYKQLKKVSLDR